MTMTLIVVAAILLVVAGLVIGLSYTKFNLFGERTESCAFKGGRCIDRSKCTDGYEIDAPDCKSTEVCCVKSFGS